MEALGTDVDELERAPAEAVCERAHRAERTAREGGAYFRPWRRRSSKEQPVRSPSAGSCWPCSRRAATGRRSSRSLARAGPHGGRGSRGAGRPAPRAARSAELRRQGEARGAEVRVRQYVRGGADRGRRARADPAADARGRAVGPRRRPDTADPRHLRPACRLGRGEVAGRARAARVQPPAHAWHVEAPRAPRGGGGPRSSAAASARAARASRSSRPTGDSPTGGSRSSARRLRDVGAHRATRRKARTRSSAPTVALAGYTNVGKSTLLNALTGAEVRVEDRLFETLDPTTRGFEYQGKRYLVTDTVGFIRRLHPLQVCIRWPLGRPQDRAVVAVRGGVRRGGEAVRLLLVRQPLTSGGRPRGRTASQCLSADLPCRHGRTGAEATAVADALAPRQQSRMSAGSLSWSSGSWVIRTPGDAGGFRQSVTASRAARGDWLRGRVAYNMFSTPVTRTAGVSPCRSSRSLAAAKSSSTSSLCWDGTPWGLLVRGSCSTRRRHARLGDVDEHHRATVAVVPYAWSRRRRTGDEMAVGEASEDEDQRLRADIDRADRGHLLGRGARRRGGIADMAAVRR